MFTIAISISFIYSTLQSTIISEFANFGNFYIFVNIRKFTKFGYFTINQQNNSSYINYINLTKSSPLAKEYVNDGSRFMEKYELLEDIYFTNFTIPLKFSSIMNPPLLNNQFLGISLSLISKDKDYSIINQLFSKNLIGQRSYSFEPCEKGKLGHIYFGELPPKFITDKKKFECDTYNEVWGCPMSSVIINYKNDVLLYSNNDKVLFQVGYEFIYVPVVFMDYIIHNIFIEYFSNKKCFTSPGKDNVSFACIYTKEIEELLPDEIRLRFHDSDIIIPKKLLFTKQVDTAYGLIYRFQFYTHKVQKLQNFWIFGGFFFQNFYSVFNYDDKKVSLFIDEKPGKVRIEKIIDKQLFLLNTIKQSLFIFTGINVLGILNISIIKFKNLF